MQYLHKYSHLFLTDISLFVGLRRRINLIIKHSDLLIIYQWFS